MPTWHTKKKEAAQRSELFGDSAERNPLPAEDTGSDYRQGGPLREETHGYAESPRPTWARKRTMDGGGGTGPRGSVDRQADSTSSSTFVQKRMVHRAIQQHQSTTASAERSLAVAENCLDIGVTTLEEVARQGEQLDRAERGLDMVRIMMRIDYDAY
jgi:hypothetical protein